MVFENATGLTQSLQLHLEGILPRGAIFSVSWRGVGEAADAELLTSLPQDQVQRFRAMRDPVRRLEWVAGQRCRGEALEALSEQGWPPEEVSLSVAHGGGLALALAVVRPGRKGWGVGVDVESAQRVVQPKVMRRLLDDRELGLQVPGLSAWCLKEAVWKAGDRSPGRVLTDYRLVDWDFDSGRARLTCEVAGIPDSLREFQAVTWEAEGFRLAVASSRGAARSVRVKK